MKIILTLLSVLTYSLSCMATDFEEVNLNTATHEREQFLNYPPVLQEFDKVLAIGGEHPKYEFSYFVSFRNILPPGLPKGRYIANEHVAIFKSRLDSTMCSVRVNVVWRNDNGLNTLDEDYSEPAQYYSCYKL